MNETIAETVVAATEIVTETVTTVTLIEDQYLVMVEYLNWMTGFLLFFVVVLLCYFGYKFFRIFF